MYGVTTATVKVGYEYSDCADVIWEVQTTKLSGHDMSISDIGGWNLDIHHRYNFHEGKRSLLLAALGTQSTFMAVSFLVQGSFKRATAATCICAIDRKSCAR